MAFKTCKTTLYFINICGYSKTFDLQSSFNFGRLCGQFIFSRAKLKMLRSLFINAHN